MKAGQRFLWFFFGALSVAAVFAVVAVFRAVPRGAFMANLRPPEAYPAVKLKRLFPSGFGQAAPVPEVAWPAGLGEMQLDLKDFSDERMQAQDVKVRLVPFSALESRLGKFAQIVVECRRLNFEGLVFDNLRLDCRDAQVHLPRLLQEKKLEFLHLGELRPSVEVGTDTLRTLVARHAPWLQEPRVSLADGVRIQGKAFGLPVEALARVWLAPDRLSAGYELESLRAGGIPLAFLTARIEMKKVFPLSAGGAMPFALLVDGLEWRPNAVVVRGKAD